MSSRSQRRFQMKYAHITAIVAGIFVAVIGLYFIAVIRGETDKKNAKCTEKTTGVVTEVKSSGSDFLNTVDYVGDDVDCTVTIETKNNLGVGTKLEVYYEPLTPKHIYIEGITKTGSSDVVTGLVMILAGAVLAALGIFVKKLDRPKTGEDG